MCFLALAAACGSIVALMGLMSGGSTWGTGYTTTKLLVEGSSIPWWLTVGRSVSSLRRSCARAACVRVA